MYLKEERRPLGGFTLTEAAIVLGIVGLILGAIWVAATSVYNNIRVKRTSEQLLQIVQSIRSMHSTTSTLGSNDDLTADFSKAGVFPADMLDGVTDTSPVDIWGGDVAVQGVTVDGNVGAGFVVTFEMVPQAACIDLIVRNTGQGRDTGLSKVEADGGSETAFPISVSDAADACSVTASTGNTLQFTFKLKG